MKKSYLNNQILEAALNLLALIFLILAVFTPSWSIRGFGLAEFGLLQTVTITTQTPPQSVTLPLEALSGAEALASAFTVILLFTLIGLACIIATFVLSVISVRGGISIKYVKIAEAVASILVVLPLMYSVVYVPSAFNQYAKASGASELAGFWGYGPMDVPGGRLQGIWGAGFGWYMDLTAFMLLILALFSTLTERFKTP